MRYHCLHHLRLNNKMSLITALPAGQAHFIELAS